MSKATTIRAILRPIGQRTKSQIPAVRFAPRARGYASGGQAAGNSTLLYGGLAAAAIAVGGYYVYSNQQAGDGHLQSGYSTEVKDAASPKVVDYQKVCP